MAKKKLKYWVKGNTLDELYDLAKEKSKELFNDENNWMESIPNWLYVKHQDGSKFKFRFCFMRWGRIDHNKKFKPEMLIAISEHNGIMIFHLDDLEYIKIVESGKKRTVLRIVEPKEGKLKLSTYQITE